MNYYPRYPGDYMRDTGHLSLTEHGAYTVLLDHYYAKAEPLPASVEALGRLCRAMTSAEQEAVNRVAEEFFPVADDGLRHNARADAEISDWQTYSAKQRALSRLGVEAKRAKKAQRATERTTERLSQRLTPPPPPPPPPPAGVFEDSDSRPQADVKAKPAYEGEEFRKAVIAAYHDTLPDLPRVKVWTEKRQQALKARIRERLKDGKPADTLDYWRRLFGQVAASDFLTGRKTDFRADLPWLLLPENFAKVIEGRYAPGNGRADHAR